MCTVAQKKVERLHATYASSWFHLSGSRSFIPREIFNDVCALHLLSTGSSKILSKTSLRTSKTISLLNINNISKNTITGVSIYTKTTTGQRIVHVSRFLSHDVHNSVTFGRGVGMELDDLKACTQHIN